MDENDDELKAPIWFFSVPLRFAAAYTLRLQMEQDIRSPVFSLLLGRAQRDFFNSFASYHIFLPQFRVEFLLFLLFFITTIVSFLMVLGFLARIDALLFMVLCSFMFVFLPSPLYLLIWSISFLFLFFPPGRIFGLDEWFLKKIKIWEWVG